MMMMMIHQDGGNGIETIGPGGGNLLLLSPDENISIDTNQLIQQQQKLAKDEDALLNFTTDAQF